jgi:hypothetical protein
MSKRLTCPECGNDTFTQQRSMIYDESVVAKFNSRGEVDDEFIEDSECSGEESALAHECKQCGWELVDEDGDPITEPDEVVAVFESASIARQRLIGKPADIPDDPKAHYSLTGEWRGWRDFLGVPDDSPICDECGNHPCDCGMDVAAKEASK